jgi:hypothetical protein
MEPTARIMLAKSRSMSLPFSLAHTTPLRGALATSLSRQSPATTIAYMKKQAVHARSNQAAAWLTGWQAYRAHPSTITPSSSASLVRPPATNRPVNASVTSQREMKKKRNTALPSCSVVLRRSDDPSSYSRMDEYTRSHLSHSSQESRVWNTCVDTAKREFTAYLRSLFSITCLFSMPNSNPTPLPAPDILLWNQ